MFASNFWKRDFQNERGDREDGGEIESWEKMHLYYFYYTVFEITEKVSINIASKASYVYMMSGQKVHLKCQKWSICRVFEHLKLAVKQRYQTSHF